MEARMTINQETSGQPSEIARLDSFYPLASGKAGGGVKTTEITPPHKTSFNVQKYVQCDIFIYLFFYKEENKMIST